MHSPTPWRSEMHSEGYWIKDKDGLVVAVVDAAETSAADKANAELIARSVNAVSEISNSMIRRFDDVFTSGYWSAYSESNSDRIKAALRAALDPQL